MPANPGDAEMVFYYHPDPAPHLPVKGVPEGAPIFYRAPNGELALHVHDLA